MGEDWNKILYRGVEIPTEMLHIGSRLVQGLIASKLLTYKIINIPFTMTMAGGATPVALHCVSPVLCVVFGKSCFVGLDMQANFHCMYFRIS